MSEQGAKATSMTDQIIGRIGKANQNVRELHDLVTAVGDNIFGPRPPQPTAPGKITTDQKTVLNSLDYLESTIDDLRSAINRLL